MRQTKLSNTRPSRGPSVGLEPSPGYYRTRLVKDGPVVPVKLWFGPPSCPDTGTPLDRAHRLRAMVAGEECDPHEIWPLHPIDEATYAALLAAMPDDPRVKRDLSREPPLW